MAHRQGLDDSSTNGALARAAVRNREVVDLHTDAGAALLAKALVQIVPKALELLAKPAQVGAKQRTIL